MYKFLYGHKFSTHLSNKCQVWLLDHMKRKCVFCKNDLPDCFLKWLYHFAFLPAWNESPPCCSLSSPASGGICILTYDHSNSMQWYFLFVLICVLLMMYDVEHSFISLFTIRTSLAKCSFKSFAQFG